MLYCEYETYRRGGGAMSPEEFDVWAPRASRAIDYLTYGRAEGRAADLAAELADACGQIAEQLRTVSEVQTRSGGGLLASAGNDGVSESYVTGNSASAALARRLREILALSLGADRYGLLGRWIF